MQIYGPAWGVPMTRLVRPGGSPPTPRSVDVARLAGVSQKTVSRVLNDEPYVTADLRRRVLDAAEEFSVQDGAAAVQQPGKITDFGVRAGDIVAVVRERRTCPSET